MRTWRRECWRGDHPEIIRQASTGRGLEVAGSGAHWASCEEGYKGTIHPMRVFDLFRYVKPSPGPEVEFIDGVRNIFNATRWPAWAGLVGAGRVQLDHGIDSVKIVRAVDGPRRPAILIASKPHQAGSDWTPWHDELDAERGHVRYYGDNKAETGVDAHQTVGNRS